MTVHADQELRLASLDMGPDMTTTGDEFRNCALLGPAVVWFVDCTFKNCVFEHPGPTPDGVLWTPPVPDGLIAGAMQMVGCIFDGCRFQGIGYTGAPGDLARWREALTKYHSDN
jgi:hypothetical protein